jgi:hypothetical protein
MAHYAKIVNNIVTQVIVAEADFFDSFIDTSPGKWIQTSYNTNAGVHSDSDGTPLRKNFAGIGFTYDKTKDAFIPPKRYPSWLLNDSTCQWEPPVAYPDADSDERYSWNEETTSWDLG